MSNSTTEHDTTESVTPFHSESTAHSNDINISYYEKIPKIGENPLIIDLTFYQNLFILQHVQNTKQFISVNLPS